MGSDQAGSLRCWACPYLALNLSPPPSGHTASREQNRANRKSKSVPQHCAMWLRRVLVSLGCPGHLLLGKADLTIPICKMGGSRKQLKPGSPPQPPFFQQCTH